MRALDRALRRALDRALREEAAHARAVEAYEVTPDRYAQIYKLARDWAEREAEACGDGPLPIWSPSYESARREVRSDMPADVELCLTLAVDSWRRICEIRSSVGEI